jgi:DNA replication protein DnaC
MDTIISKFKDLRLKNCADHIAEILETAASKNLSQRETIERLLDFELEAREQARINQRFKQANLDEKTTLDGFDFKHHVSRQNYKALILHLMDLDFIHKRKDVILIGNPGVGKSHLAKCLAYAATQKGIKTLFTTAMDMINHLITAEANHSLLKKLQHYQSQDLLVVDEIGYLPLGKQGSHLFFQVISARHNKKSTVITTNLPFAQWSNIFDGTTAATAIADRLIYNSEILILEGQSYRTKS